MQPASIVHGATASHVIRLYLQCGMTSGTFSGRSGVVCVVRALLSACPESVNDLDYGSRTPLHLAAAQGWVEVATHLLQNGAEVDYR